MSRAMRQAAGEGYSTATDLADWLVRTLKLPFRDAHHVTGRIVAKAAEAGVPLDKLPLAAMQAVEPRITKAVFGVLSVDKSVKSRSAYGGTAPKNVRAQAKRWLKRLQKARVNAPATALARCCRHNVAAAMRSAMLAASQRCVGERLLALDRLSVGLALAAAVRRAFGLAGCGRDGPLELPPGRLRGRAVGAPSAPPSLLAQVRPARLRGGRGAGNRRRKTGFDAQGNPVAPAGQKKTFILDPLLQ